MLARVAHSNDVLSSPAFEYLDITSLQFRECSPAAYFASHRVDLDSESIGMLYDDRFRFQITCRSECGLRIYRVAPERLLVIISMDGESYGMSPTNAAENIATAVRHIFGLNPSHVTWIERYAKSSGQEHESCDQLSFEYDLARELYLNPAWNRIRTPSIGEYLRDLGIEW